MSGFHAIPIWLIPIFSTLLLMVFHELGRMLFRFAPIRDAAATSTLQAAVLGLLALVLSFSFASSLTHFDERREAATQDANTISTTALRARMLPEPYQSRMLDLLHEYMALRIEATHNIRDTSQLGHYVERSDALQESMWRQTLALADTDPKPVPTGLFIQSLNDLFDIQVERVAITRNRIPDGVIVGLYLIASFVAAFTGYANKSSSWRARIPSYAVYALIAGVMYLIQDLDRPWEGVLRTNQQPILDVARSLVGYTD